MVDAPRCEFPGCTRPSRSETGTGRPPKYCEEADPAGGPVHNRLNAYRLRQARPRAVDVAEASPGTVRPVSIATMGLEQAIAGFLAGADALATQLTAVTTHVRTASDLDAAVAEVEDTRREADLKIGEAEGRASVAERAVRAAEDRAAAAESDRDNAEAAAEAALAELEQHRREMLEAREASALEIAAANTAVEQARLDVAQAQAAQRDVSFHLCKSGVVHHRTAVRADRRSVL